MFHVQASSCSSSHEAHTDHTVCSVTKMQPPVCLVSIQGSSLETQRPKTFLGAGHIGTLCLAHTQIPDSQERRFVGQASPEEQNPRSYRMRWRGDF